MQSIPEPGVSRFHAVLYKIRQNHMLSLPSLEGQRPYIYSLKGNKSKQECSPVGCVLPTSVAVSGSSGSGGVYHIHPGHPWTHTPPFHHQPPPCEQND